MAKEEMIAKQIAEINHHIRDGVNQWADTMLMADADQWAVHLTYYPRDIVNACMIFQHICSNVGIKAGRIDEKKAEEYGKRLRQLVIDMTGYDPADIVSQMKPKEDKDDDNREQLSPEMEALLSQKTEELDLSVRTRNLLKANGIDTIRDLCRLKKTDWLKFRNGGKRSLTELNDFLTDHNLTWGMNV